MIRLFIVILFFLGGLTEKNGFCGDQTKNNNSGPYLIAYADSHLPLIADNTVITEAIPLQILSLIDATGYDVTVTDGLNRVYVQMPVKPLVQFKVGGALGIHTVVVKDKKGNETARLTFHVDAKTKVDDGGTYKEMFDLFYKGMCVYSPDGVLKVSYKDKEYHFFINWGLDNYNNLKGMQYFSSVGNELNDLFKLAQREDGMIWSNVSNDDGEPGYFETSYGPWNYVKREGKTLFVRQPTENHPEYLYVTTTYQLWKANGNDEWMKSFLSSCSRALDYSVSDPSRWSTKYKLLKRVYTIDSWDFQIDDEYTPYLGVGNAMLVDAKKSHFGIFFGDNTGYIQACEDLAAMYDYAGMKADADKFRTRASEIRERLDALAWNGKFYTHYIEEDENIHRHLGVDEKSQIAQSNMYSLNRDIPYKKKIAIINTYLELKQHLPAGSMGEWYAIYPPFERGFGAHNEKWQYMNGGLAGHAVGELARGAFELGFETYGTELLLNLFDLGKKYDNRIWFAYTGSIPPAPPAPNFKTIDLTPFANMDLNDQGSKDAFKYMGLEEPGNDLRNLPVGDQTLADIKFKITDPLKNNHKSAIVVSSREGYPKQVEIPVHDTTRAIYLLHNIEKPGSENVCGAVSFNYEDGSQKVNYIILGKQLSGWWFPANIDKTKDAGLAWTGNNPVCKKVGAYWAVFNNPFPGKKIRSITIHAAEGESLYAVFAVTLADREHYVAPKVPSFGGPDNWAAANLMAALIEGEAGVKDLAVTYKKVLLSPRWISANVDSVDVTARYAASTGYITYRFVHHKNKKEIKIVTTGNGDQVAFHILLPKGISEVKEVWADNQKIKFSHAKVEHSDYVDFNADGFKPREYIIRY